MSLKLTEKLKLRICSKSSGMATLILMSARPCTAVGEMVKYSELFPVRNTWNMLFTPCRRKDKKDTKMAVEREQGQAVIYTLSIGDEYG